jgi:hypothetical protein
MKTLLAFLVLCSVSYGAGPRYTYRVVRTYQARTPMANPSVCTCSPCNCVQTPSQVLSTPIVISTPTVQYVSTPTFFDSHPVQATYPIASAVVETVKAPILFFQENQPVRSVIKSITPDCANGQCKLK